jgi:hypothetical protein
MDHCLSAYLALMHALKGVHSKNYSCVSHMRRSSTTIISNLAMFAEIFTYKCSLLARRDTPLEEFFRGVGRKLG